MSSRRKECPTLYTPLHILTIYTASLWNSLPVSATTLSFKRSLKSYVCLIVLGSCLLSVYVMYSLLRLKFKKRNRRRRKTTWKKWENYSFGQKWYYNVQFCIQLSVDMYCTSQKLEIEGKNSISKCMGRIQIPWQPLYTGYYHTL